VDSIPAIFAVTPDPFIVYTSNIFAILGLRSLYFALAGVIGKFHYLKIGLAVILVFVGTKMLIVDIYHVPVLLSLAAVAGILGASVVASLLRPRDPKALGRWNRDAPPLWSLAQGATGFAFRPVLNLE
jgi:tellurite resistance protein TerC